MITFSYTPLRSIYFICTHLKIYPREVLHSISKSKAWDTLSLKITFMPVVYIHCFAKSLKIYIWCPVLYALSKCFNVGGSQEFQI